MAERPGTPPPSGAPGPHAAAPQGASSTPEQRAPEQEPGQERRHPVQELTAQGEDVAAQAAAQGQKYVRAWQTQLDQQVREKPLQSILMAAGIGLLFGLLKRR
jgi:ElaB/YqjD/DUF883 family membrane-anchored ribosome-binding protein